MKKLFIVLIILFLFSGCGKKEETAEPEKLENTPLVEDISGDYYAISCRDKDGKELTLNDEVLHLYADGTGLFEIEGESYTLTYQLDDHRLTFTDEDGDSFEGNYYYGTIAGTYFNDYHYMFSTDKDLYETSADADGVIDTPPDVKPQIETADSTAAYYQLQTLYEPTYGIKTAYGFVPYGWSASASVSWGICSAMYPAIGVITMVSPDKDAMIEIVSTMGYLQMARKGSWIAEGTYLDLYNIFLNYRNAREYNDYILGILGYKGTILNTQGPSYEYQLELNGIANAYLASQSNSGITGKQCEGTFAKTSYFITEGSAYEVEIVSSVIMAETINGFFDTYSWFVPCSATFTTYSEEAYSKYFRIFDNVVANSSFSNEFIYVVNRNAKYINDMISQYLLEKVYSPSSSDIRQWDSEYVQTDSDQFINAWCDVIKEQNEYTTVEGTPIKIPTAYDSVYQDGDYIYMGPQSQAPQGWTELDKK